MVPEEDPVALDPPAAEPAAPRCHEHDEDDDRGRGHQLEGDVLEAGGRDGRDGHEEGVPEAVRGSSPER